MLDKAKAFASRVSTRKQWSRWMPGRSQRAPRSQTSDFEIRIVEAFRFNVEDTLVFKVRVRNKSDREIPTRQDRSPFGSGTDLYPAVHQ